MQTLEKGVIEGNKIIAEFMEHGIYPCAANYHAQWSLLMPVIEKIIKNKMLKDAKPYTLGHENITFKLEYDGHYRKWSSIFYGDIGYWDEATVFHKIELPYKRHEGGTNIESTWLAVIDFIKFYNKNNK